MEYIFGIISWVLSAIKNTIDTDRHKKYIDSDYDLTFGIISNFKGTLAF